MKGDRIVHSTGVSARMPGYSPMVPAGMTNDEYFQWFEETMMSTGADGYYVLHNHPNGDPTPSRRAATWPAGDPGDAGDTRPADGRTTGKEQRPRSGEG